MILSVALSYSRYCSNSLSLLLYHSRFAAAPTPIEERPCKFSIAECSCCLQEPSIFRISTPTAFFLQRCNCATSKQLRTKLSAIGLSSKPIAHLRTKLRLNQEPAPSVAPSVSPRASPSLSPNPLLRACRRLDQLPPQASL